MSFELPQKDPLHVSEHTVSMENDESTSNDCNQSRRSFLKGLLFAGVSIAAADVALKDLDEIFADEEGGPLSQEKFDSIWFEAIERIHEEIGVDDVINMRARFLIDELGIPTGETSAVTQNRESDRVITEMLTNTTHQIVENGSITTDFREYYPEGLPEELLNAFEDPRTRRIFEVSYILKDYAKECESRDDYDPSDLEGNQIDYQRLPGGIDFFLVGYIHTDDHQELYGSFYSEMARNAEVVSIESYADIPFGESLHKRWAKKASQGASHYEQLIKDTAQKGFSGLFTEVDARDHSRVSQERMFNDGAMELITLPDSYYTDYFNFIAEQNPSYAKKVASPENLRALLQKQSTGNREYEVRLRENIKYFASGYHHPGKESASRVPTGFELGELLFSDALAAIKTHLIARLMNEGAIKKGPIVDVIGSAHSSSKQFYMRYPQHAMEVVLRSMPHLLASEAQQHETNDATASSHMNSILAGIDWEDVVKKICYIPLSKTESLDDFPDKTPYVDEAQVLGKEQLAIKDNFYGKDFAMEALGIDVERAIPSDEVLAKAYLRQRQKHDHDTTQTASNLE